MLDGISHLLLKDHFRSPSDSGVGASLHEEHGRFSMMDRGEVRAAIPDLRSVDRSDQRFSAGFLQRCLDLVGNALRIGIGHGEPNVVAR